jgi:hypothetical protein
VSILALGLGIALAVVAVVLVALPFLREPVTTDDRLDAPNAEESRHLGLVEERDRALAALKELEFDHRTGKVGDEDYRELLGPLRRQAAAALRSLDDREPRYRSEMSSETPGRVPRPDSAETDSLETDSQE